MKKNRKKGITIGLIVIVVAIVAYFIFGISGKQKVFFQTAQAQMGSISNIVTATGTIEPITQVEVGTQVSGIIDRIYVDYNSVVKKGQIIAELDKTVLESELKSKKADLEASKVEYDYQQKNYDRMKLLYQKKLISDADFEEAQYSYGKAKSTYEKNEADLVKVKTNLNYAIIYAPIDGIVLSRAVEEGQTVAASFSTPTLFTIAADLTQMEVVADVDEADIGQVEVGQRVTFTVDAFPNDIFEGKVTQVRLEATTTSNVVTYEVIVNAPNPDMKLKPGLTANITIYTLEQNDILTIPSRALRFVPDPELLEANGIEVEEDIPTRNVSFQKTVWQKVGNTLRPKSIAVGITNGSITEVIDGLDEGEEVVTEVVAADIPTAAAPSGESSPFMPQRPGADKKK